MLTVGLFVVTELAVSNIIEPWLYGSHTGISSLAILVAAVFWTVLWGPIGLILSTPLTVCLVVLGRHVPQLEFLNILLGDEPVLPVEAHFYQRLLALDYKEARDLIDAFLKEGSLLDLYDSHGSLRGRPGARHLRNVPVSQCRSKWSSRRPTRCKRCATWSSR
jgi:hypothetical protein